MSTGSHGSSLRHGSLSSQVRGGGYVGEGRAGWGRGGEGKTVTLGLPEVIPVGPGDGRIAHEQRTDAFK